MIFPSTLNDQNLMFQSQLNLFLKKNFLVLCCKWLLLECWYVNLVKAKGNSVSHQSAILVFRIEIPAKQLPQLKDATVTDASLELPLACPQAECKII